VRSCGGEVRLFELPAGFPQMSAMGEVWRRSKSDARDSAHYPNIEAMRVAAGGCLGVRRRLDAFRLRGASDFAPRVQAREQLRRPRGAGAPTQI